MELADKLEGAISDIGTQQERLEQELQAKQYIEDQLRDIRDILEEEFESTDSSDDLRDCAPIDDRYIRALENANIWTLPVLELSLSEWDNPQESLLDIPCMTEEGVEQICTWLS